jgi:hypothetical protein
MVFGFRPSLGKEESTLYKRAPLAAKEAKFERIPQVPPPSVWRVPEGDRLEPTLKLERATNDTKRKQHCIPYALGQIAEIVPG